jgi:uncharacterized caspase-like protein
MFRAALRIAPVLLGFLACLMLPATALAEKRVALVVGVSAYQHVAKLPNPANDAGAVAGLLKTAGFDVVETRRDVGVAELRRAVGDFTEQARNADVAVVFFAGHGIEVDGTNYLIPADAKLARDFDIEDEALSLDRVLRAIEPAKRLRLVILDACRDNPFAKEMKRTVASRAVGRGLAKIEPTVADTLIAFAAKAGSVALDGEEANSPFTKALLQHIAVPDLDLRIAFGRVRDSVLEATSRKQEPYVYGSLGGNTVSIVNRAVAVDARAKPEPGQQVAAASPDVNPARVASSANLSSQAALSSAEVAEAWRATSNTTNPAVLESFIRRFGDTIYGDLAKARLQDMKVAAKPEERAVQPAQTSSKPSAAVPASVPQIAGLGASYLGCFKDVSKRDLDGHTFYDNKMTTQLCVAACKKAGFAYAATQYAYHCFCGNKYGSAGPASNCDAKCTGNPSETCGGTWANSVYKID